MANRLERTGMSPDEIVSDRPSLTLSDVHAALASDFDHGERIDSDIIEGEQFADDLRAGVPSIFEEFRLRRADAANDPVPPR